MADYDFIEHQFYERIFPVQVRLPLKGGYDALRHAASDQARWCYAKFGEPYVWEFRGKDLNSEAERFWSAKLYYHWTFFFKEATPDVIEFKLRFG